MQGVVMDKKEKLMVIKAVVKDYLKGAYPDMKVGEECFEVLDKEVKRLCDQAVKKAKSLEKVIIRKDHFLQD